MSLGKISSKYGTNFLRNKYFTKICTYFCTQINWTHESWTKYFLLSGSLGIIQLVTNHVNLSLEYFNDSNNACICSHICYTSASGEILKPFVVRHHRELVRGLVQQLTSLVAHQPTNQLIHSIWNRTWGINSAWKAMLAWSFWAYNHPNS